MSILIDELLKKNFDQREVLGTSYIVKPTDKKSFMQRYKDAIMVLWGNAQAYHYFDDEAETWGEVCDREIRK